MNTALMDQLPALVLAVGGLGTSAYALVDAFKALPGGGPSKVGFDRIELLAKRLLDFPGDLPSGAETVAIVIDTLRANWINGMPLADQKAVARSLIKLYMDPEASAHAAAVLGLPAGDLQAVARLWRNGPSKEEPANDPGASTVGRVDLALTALLDGVYQHADQRYRNVCKLAAGGVAVAISTVSGLTIYQLNDLRQVILCVVAGFVAVPLAPMAKDLASALQAGVKVAQSLRR